MRNTLSIRLPDDLVSWLDETASQTRVPKGRVVRRQLELARAKQEQPFIRLAGSIAGPKNLSSRKGFSLE